MSENSSNLPVIKDEAGNSDPQPTSSFITHGVQVPIAVLPPAIIPQSSTPQVPISSKRRVIKKPLVLPNQQYKEKNYTIPSNVVAIDHPEEFVQTEKLVQVQNQQAAPQVDDNQQAGPQVDDNQMHAKTRADTQEESMHEEFEIIVKEQIQQIASPTTIEDSQIHKTTVMPHSMPEALVANEVHLTMPPVDANRITTVSDQEKESITTETSTQKTTHIRQKAIKQKKILDKLYTDLLKEYETGIDDDEDTCCTVCADTFCQSCGCHCSIIPFERKVILTETLRKGRAKGYDMINITIFPLLQNIVRDLWVTLELITVFIGLVLSIVTLQFNKIGIFNFVHLALAILSSVLASIDGVYTLKECKSCKSCCCKDKLETDTIDEGESQSNNKCCTCWKSTFDVLRILISEAIIYPLLICDLFEVITGRGYEGETVTDRLGFALFILSCISLVLYVYIARIVVLVNTTKSLIEVRTPSNDSERSDYYDPEIKASALQYQTFFFVHMVLQMLAQVFMFIAIGGKIRYDNRHFYAPANVSQSTNVSTFIFEDENQSIYISGHLWYMVFAGYVTPMMGFLTFFIVTYYWSQEFPIGFCVDMIGIFRMSACGLDELMYNNKEPNKQEKVTNMLEGFSMLKDLKSEYQDYHDISFFSKFAYPFKAPGLIIICLGYAGIQLAFVLCGALAINDMGVLVVQVLNGGGWVLYYVIAGVVVVVANIYVLAVAAMWTIVFAVTIIIIVCTLVTCSDDMDLKSTIRKKIKKYRW